MHWAGGLSARRFLPRGVSAITPPDPEADIPQTQKQTPPNPEADSTPPMTIEAGGTHPTGMHSCMKIKS